MIRRQPIEEEESHDRWLVSYADFITLLFAFFVVMYGTSSVNQSKYQQVSESMGSAFVGMQSESSKTDKLIKVPHTNKDSFIKPIATHDEHHDKKAKEHNKMRHMGKDIATHITEMTDNNNVRVFEVDKGIRIDISEKLLFNGSNAKIRPESEKALLAIGKELAKSRKYIQIEGHTDITPVRSKQYPSNWELSTARATSVLHVLVKAGVLETRLSAVGYGASQPLNVADTPEAQAQNRRVSIIALYEAANPSTAGTEITEATDTEAEKAKPLIIMPGKQSAAKQTTSASAANPADQANPAASNTAAIESRIQASQSGIQAFTPD